MESHYPIEGDASSKMQSLNITWEEDMLLRGVRPDSEVVSLLQSVLTSPRTKYLESVPAPSADLLSLIDSLSKGRSAVPPVPTTTSTPVERAGPRMVSPLGNIHSKPSPPGKQKVIKKEIKKGIKVGITGARPLLPANAGSPPVVVPSLLPIGHSMAPHVDNCSCVFHRHLLPPLHPPTPNTNTNTSESGNLENTSRERRRRGHPLTVVARVCTSSGTTPIKETEVTLSKLDGPPLPPSWPTVDGRTSSSSSSSRKSKKVLTLITIRKGSGRRHSGQFGDAKEVVRPPSVSGGILLPRLSEPHNVQRI
ncbi:uncharacterized protein TM35_000015530 [Trypanosoma theileri]|uniref:Uncharacterized protein n=1 Tax=Trypanosoma theileri TaxID=67003 RepID=A0A1X0P9T5_9TRYP|nr:uncharacterized protein TM35_000015530 [Trypanosoma theileri]ORC93676.1 hypothetical protein TM35_000015530 [Trypanosoma theileri]